MADETNGIEQEQTEGNDGQAQSGLRGALPMVATVAAAAAAGGIAVVARKALSGSGSGSSGDGDGEEERESTSFEDLDRVADDLSRLVDELGSAAAADGERDYKHLVEIVDAISEYADQAANAFDAAASGSDEDEGAGGRVTDDLMSKVRGLTAEGRESEEARDRVGVGSREE